ncbi:MAG: hypothetical protein HEQ23_09280 [Tepidisphaera sp.]
MTISIDIQPDTGLVINGSFIRHQCDPQAFYTALGRPDRICTGKIPAPVGHRNNHVHVYDELGICLFDNHRTLRITALLCLFDTNYLPERPQNPFRGELSIDAHPITNPISLKALDDLAMTKQLGWFVRDGTVCYVNVELRPVNRSRSRDSLHEIRCLGVSLRDPDKLGPAR